MARLIPGKFYETGTRLIPGRRYSTVSSPTGGIDVPTVQPETLVFDPVVEKELRVDVPVVNAETNVYTHVVELQKVLEVPQVLSETNVLSPDVLKQIVVSIPQVVSGTFVYNPDVVKPKFIDLNEIVQPQTDVFNPFVIIGDGIMIPVEDRFNYNKLAEFLRTQGFEGNNNDVIMDWLFSEGYEVGQFNDRMSNYLTGQGYTGALPDQKGQWKRDV